MIWTKRLSFTNIWWDLQARFHYNSKEMLNNHELWKHGLMNYKRFKKNLLIQCEISKYVWSIVLLFLKEILATSVLSMNKSF